MCDSCSPHCSSPFTDLVINQRHPVNGEGGLVGQLGVNAEVDELEIEVGGGERLVSRLGDDAEADGPNGEVEENGHEVEEDVEDHKVVVEVDSPKAEVGD